MMGRLSEWRIKAIATAIRPYITPYIEAKGSVTNDEIRKLARMHSRHAISSELSCDKVQRYLVEEPELL